MASHVQRRIDLKQLAMEERSNPALIRDRLFKPRTVFAPGHRIRMNVVPMFVNVFLPWGFYLFCSGICTFTLMYNRPVLAWGLVFCAYLLAFLLVLFAIYMRRNDPEPTWFTYLAIYMVLAVVLGTMFGTYNHKTNMVKFYEIQDLKVLNDIDASKEKGSNMMDAGILNFADGNRLDGEISWHFKHKTMYCVAPVVGSTPIPETQSYDFWAVGKDCCSMASSDFRCGEAWSVGSHSALRVFNDEDIKFYRLAVEQAQSLHNIMANHPIFFEWTHDPLGKVNSWNDEGFGFFAKTAAFFFVLCLFGVALASCQFAFIGRRESIYEATAFLQEPTWYSSGSQPQMFVH